MASAPEFCGRADQEHGKAGLTAMKAHLFHALDLLRITTITKKYDPELNLDIDCDGLYCKNLFLKDRKGNFYYVVIPLKGSVDLKKLKTVLHTKGNLSFTTKNDLWNILRSEPGAVSIFGVMYNIIHPIKIVFDISLTTVKALYFHPFFCNEATAIRFEDLVTFAEYFGHRIEVLDLDNL